MSVIDYSKWKDIEISDDEDDTHPNVDTPSLFRWRHQARVERMTKEEQEKEELEKEKKMYKKTITETQKKLEKMNMSSEETKAEAEKLKTTIKDLQKQEEDFRKKEEEIAKRERLQPWNVDTISQPGFEKTIINKPKEKSKEELTDDQKFEKTATFVEKYEKQIKEFGMLRDYNASRDFLRDHPHLVGEETASYLTIWCINLEVQDKHSLMERVAHQTMVMQYILELARTLDRDPRSCVAGFFERMKTAEKQYIEAFEDELSSFLLRIRQRAQVRIENAMKEAEEEERKKRLGPGGLDPLEVLETLPPDLKECFETQSVSKLQSVLDALGKEQASYHMQRCVDSGLWVPDAKGAGLTPANEQLQKELEEQGELPPDEAAPDEEEIYEDANDMMGLD
ncbi:hsp90 co-chaperone Cdc37-like [Dysidea avara]|uniref:hsp90 co-chaperone Cdc37-like n=1 Tax=Dysidea avara TaxID=196820 RepID=UPI00332CB759